MKDIEKMKKFSRRLWDRWVLVEVWKGGREIEIKAFPPWEDKRERDLYIYYVGRTLDIGVDNWNVGY